MTKKTGRWIFWIYKGTSLCNLYGVTSMACFKAATPL